MNSVYHMRYIGDHVFFSKLMKQLLNRGTGISVSMVRVIPVLGLCCVVVGTYYTTMYIRQQQTNEKCCDLLVVNLIGLITLHVKYMRRIKIHAMALYTCVFRVSHVCN